MEGPDVRYTRSGDVSIAYTTVGEGPFDVVFVSGWVISNLAVAWEGTAADFFEQMSSFCRLILFDKRGTGLSDRDVGIPDLQTRMDDVRAVMDAVGSERAAILGFSEGGPMASLFAATYPDRTTALVLYGTLPTFTKAEDFPWGVDRADMIAWREDLDRSGRRLTDEWCDEMLAGLSPSVANDEKLKVFWRRWCRVSSSPSALSQLSRMNAEIDVRHALAAVRVPTLVLHRVGDEDVEPECGQYLAEHIPGAIYQPLEGIDHSWWVDSYQISGAARPFLEELWRSGDWGRREPDRVLATLMFTDIVGSTALLAELGDRAWGEVLQKHHQLVRRELAKFKGHEVDTAGDGFFATFDGPARAIRCAAAITSSVEALGIQVRAGLHTGECEVLDEKVGGIAVHIGARVAAQAAPSEVLVSSTVKDLVAGSGLQFIERGSAELKGVPGTWNLYAVDASAAL